MKHLQLSLTYFWSVFSVTGPDFDLFLLKEIDLFTCFFREIFHWEVSFEVSDKTL